MSVLPTLSPEMVQGDEGEAAEEGGADDDVGAEVEDEEGVNNAKASAAEAEAEKEDAVKVDVAKRGGRSGAAKATKRKAAAPAGDLPHTLITTMPRTHVSKPYGPDSQPWSSNSGPTLWRIVCKLSVAAWKHLSPLRVRHRAPVHCVH